jgi:lipoate-protein ligase A
MQHGGILLAASPLTPALPGIAERTGRQLSADAVTRAVSGELGRATGWEVVPGSWTTDERARIEQLRAEKYATPRWNQKR